MVFETERRNINDAKVKLFALESSHSREPTSAKLGQFGTSTIASQPFFLA